MAKHTTMAGRILDVGEHFLRTRGYNGFSFRDIAKEVGIKSASVHYHYPTKDDLVKAAAKRCRRSLRLDLGDPDDPTITPEELLKRYIQAYRKIVIDQQRMCLCGLLGAEIGALPEPLVEETQKFFDTNIEWLERVLIRKDGNAGDVHARALHILSAIQGALIVTRTCDDPEAFDEIAAKILGI